MTTNLYRSPSLTPSSEEHTPEIPYLVTDVETRGFGTSHEDIKKPLLVAATAEAYLHAKVGPAYVEPLCAQDEINQTYNRTFAHLNLWDRSYALDQSNHASKTLAVQALSSSIPTAQASSSSSARATWGTTQVQSSVITSTSRATHIPLSPSSSSQMTAEHAATIRHKQKKECQYRCDQCRTILSRKDALNRHIKESCPFSPARNVHGRASARVPKCPRKRPSTTASGSGSKPTAMVECMRKISLGPLQQ